MSWARAALYSAVRRVGLVMLPYVSERSSTLVQGQAQPEAGNFPIHHHQHALPLPDSLPAKTTLSQHLCPDISPPWDLPSHTIFGTTACPWPYTTALSTRHILFSSLRYPCGTFWRRFQYTSQGGLEVRIELHLAGRPGKEGLF
jgi:hypothetical protein